MTLTNKLPPSKRLSERADSYSIMNCGLCPNAHVALKDKNGDIYADFTIAPYQLSTFTEGLKTAFSAARHDEQNRQNEGS